MSLVRPVIVPAAPSGGGGSITHGRQVNAATSGYTSYFDSGLGRSLVLGDLSSQGPQTISTSNGTIYAKRYTGTLVVNGNNNVIRGCLFDSSGGSSTKAVTFNGTGNTIEYCTIAAAGSSSFYMGVSIGGDGSYIRYCDISKSENCLTIEAGNTLVEYCYLHDADNTSNPSGHVDTVEVYGGSNVDIRLNRFGIGNEVTAAINIAPWLGSTSVSNCFIEDNFIDGGNAHVLVDLQSTGTITNTRVRRNDMGGHTNVGVFGRYAALQNSDGRAITQNEAAQAGDVNSILWPSSGADRNLWAECSDLSPNNTGQTVSP